VVPHAITHTSSTGTTMKLSGPSSNASYSRTHAL
jgi:hypothetical protein